MSRRSYWGYYSQPSSYEIKSRADKAISQSKKNKGQEFHPIIATGRQIARKWWGIAWCENLERYADFSSRIDRGKRYVRAGAVVDLQIEEGCVIARVQGSRRTPYTVTVKIDPLDANRAEEIIAQCARKINNLESLLSGDFPEELQGLFTKKNGLFPPPKEIHFDCTCPDWAYMCKHIAATLYGVGVRLDGEPLLFFQLRGIDVNRFIDTAVANRVELMLDNARKSSTRIITDQDLTELFGVFDSSTPATPGKGNEGAAFPREGRKEVATEANLPTQRKEKEGTEADTKPQENMQAANPTKVEKSRRVKKTVTTAMPGSPEIIIQSPTGKEITLEAIRGKIGGADKAYVRVDHNKVYWVHGNKTGEIDLW